MICDTIPDSDHSVAADDTKKSLIKTLCLVDILGRVDILAVYLPFM